ncbi:MULTISPECIES: hypothetical protein [Ferrimonas]|uniref:hypothetical protein n=1 Tax=Ferrimonas TaxID=44011 RepID=UPI000416F03E|nr:MULTISPECIES: hypothetical protein [Ferrimonas]USD38725.1 tetrachloroethene dehalogenase [Ferrimonas sp. SCSIO 43195]
MMGLMWYLMGMGTTAALWGYLRLRCTFALDWKANLGLWLAFVLLWVCVGWSWGSFAEGEPQSGAMGLLCFGLSSLMVTVLTVRHWVLPARK